MKTAIPGILDATVFVPFQKSVAVATERVVALVDREVRSRADVNPDAIQKIVHDAVKRMPEDVRAIAVHAGYDRLDRWRDAASAVLNMGSLLAIVDKIQFRRDLDDAIRQSRIEMLFQDMRHVGIIPDTDKRPGFVCLLRDRSQVLFAEDYRGAMRLTVILPSREEPYTTALFYRES